uniref:DNA ligase (ATP) n=1 Tax=Roseihalotalea indica TaxID=2867963 RepID=A0AA49JIQ6_9BACT|nr:ATP-dependent DNA ligase [Tunicatimonas sp. TK19036]
MKQFAQLFSQLDQTNKTNDKVALLKEYFATAPDRDKLWTIAFFSHKRPKRPVTSTLLKAWTMELAGLPEWLFRESYSFVGDLAETLSLLLPSPTETQDQPLSYWIDYLQSLSRLDETTKKEKVLAAWRQMTQPEQLVFTKLMTSSFRIGVSQNLAIRALAEQYNIDKTLVAHRLMGNWHPNKVTFESLVLEENHEDNLSRPYPFFLAHPVTNEDVPNLGEIDEWQAEWKWDGIRSQIIVREGKLYVWSRGEELITDKFPELQLFQEFLPDGTVIDGEILPYKNDQILPFALLQTRIGRKNLTKSILKNAPVIIMAYDLLEWEGQDVREWPLVKRRATLETLQQELHQQIPPFQLSTVVNADSWEVLAELREQSRSLMAEGFMLKRKASPYQVGRKRGDWWKWKVDPLTIDGVLINAQRGTGRRSGLYTDYTFAVWDESEGERRLVPFTKAYSGLTDEEIRQVDAFVKRNTREKFGPVRSVAAEQVFEIAFEGIQRSTRHKSGVALRFPRILRWRHDKQADEANTLVELQELLELYGTN